jgi:hypothetical protein
MLEQGVWVFCLSSAHDTGKREVKEATGAKVDRLRFLWAAAGEGSFENIGMMECES